MSAREYRIVPAVDAGYGGPAGADRYVVQYRDRGMPWFDVGGPLTHAEAQARFAAKVAGR